MIAFQLMIVSMVALAGSADQPAFAAAPPAPAISQSLQAGEVLLEVNAIGEASAEADTAELTVSVMGRGADEAAARTANIAVMRQVDTAFTAAGVRSSEIIRGEVMASVMPAEMMDGMGADLPRATATNSYTIRLRDTAKARQLQQTLSRIDNVISRTQYSVTDDSAPQRAARTQALEKARAEAQDYAATLNMRIVRMVRVTERTGINIGDISAMEGPMRGRMSQLMGGGSSSTVPSFAFIGVDYVLAPR